LDASARDRVACAYAGDALRAPLCLASTIDRSRRGAGNFLCFAKESHQRKATARGRPSAPLALQGVSGPCAKLARSRLRRATGSDTRPARLRCRPAPLRRPRSAEHLRRAGIGHGDGLMPLKSPSSAGRAGAFGHRLSEARGSARSAEIVRVSMAAGPTEQHRGPPQAATARARLSLVTFFAKTKKVTGRAALKRGGEGSALYRISRETKCSGPLGAASSC
jgi:hypothetical protein